MSYVYTPCVRIFYLFISSLIDPDIVHPHILSHVHVCISCAYILFNYYILRVTCCILYVIYLYHVPQYSMSRTLCANMHHFLCQVLLPHTQFYCSVLQIGCCMFIPLYVQVFIRLHYYIFTLVLRYMWLIARIRVYPHRYKHVYAYI